jgi:hypothetical protein
MYGGDTCTCATTVGKRLAGAAKMNNIEGVKDNFMMVVEYASCF